MRPLNNHYDGYYKKTTQKINGGEDGENSVSSYIAGGYVMVQLL